MLIRITNHGLVMFVDERLMSDNFHNTLKQTLNLVYLESECSP